MSTTQPKGYCPVFGNYPKEYNRAVHGPYYPWVNYNPSKDVHFSEVKLGELKGWLSRRNFTPQAMVATCSRYSWLWAKKWSETRHGSFSKPFIHTIFLCSFISMFSMYGALRAHRNHKYHW